LPDQPIDIVPHDVRDAPTIINNTNAEVNDLRSRTTALEALPPGGGGSAGTSGGLVVAASDQPQAVKDGADYVCDGTADQVQINLAIDAAAALASRNAGMPAGAKQQGSVTLTGGRFNLNSSINMRTGVWLRGQGYLTEVNSTGNTTHAIKLAATDDHLVRVSDMYLVGSGTGGTGNAIDFDMASSLTSDYPGTNPDSYHLIENLYIYGFQGNRTGIKVYDSGSGNNRGFVIQKIQMRGSTSRPSGTGHGIQVEGSDSLIEACHVANCAGSGYYLGGGNTMLTGSKSFYCGTGLTIASSRALVTGFSTQDDSTGVIINTEDNTFTGLLVDSPLVDGIVVNQNHNEINGFKMVNRLTHTITRGIHFAGAYSNMFVTGMIKTTGNTITTPVSGSVPVTPSFVRIVRGGGTDSGVTAVG